MNTESEFSCMLNACCVLTTHRTDDRRKSTHQWSQTDEDPRSVRFKSCATIAANTQLAHVQEERESQRLETRLLHVRVTELEEQVRLGIAREAELLRRVGEGEKELSVAVKTMSSLAAKVRVGKNVVRGGESLDGKGLRTADGSAEEGGRGEDGSRQPRQTEAMAASQGTGERSSRLPPHHSVFY